MLINRMIYLLIIRPIYLHFDKSHSSVALVIVHWRSSPRKDCKGWPSSDIQMYTGGAWICLVFSTFIENEQRDKQAKYFYKYVLKVGMDYIGCIYL